MTYKFLASSSIDDTIGHIVRYALVDPVDGFERTVDLAREVRRKKNAVYFIGNGGSAAIASHMAADWLKNGKFNARCFNDGPLLTCLSNDLGYQDSFVVPLYRCAKPGDLIFAISSSGNSANIIDAVSSSISQHIDVIALTGMASDNHLRQFMRANYDANHNGVSFHVSSMKYGTVEITHLAILHAILDRIMEDDAKDT